MALATEMDGHQHRRSGSTTLTLSQEILSLNALSPETVEQIKSLFAESVVNSASKILGEAAGEALVRCIGDANLKHPTVVYSRLDSFLLGGSQELKKAILADFRARVHSLYKLTMDAARASQVKVLASA